MTATITPRVRDAKPRTTSDPSPRTLAHRGLTLLRQALEMPHASFSLVLTVSGLLVGFGLLMVLSSSSYLGYQMHDDPYYFVKRQAVFLVAGAVMALIISRFHPSMLRIAAWAGLALAFVLLLLTYTSFGVPINGNRNWLEIGPVGLQPSEFAKIAIVVWGADILARKEKLLDQPRHLVIPYLPVTGMIIALVVFQHDLGTAIVMSLMVIAVLFVLGVPLRIFAVVAALAAIMVTGLMLTNANRMKRLVGFLDPTLDPDGVNRQAQVALEAFASGGWWGVGLGGSRLKWGFIQEAQTDFIFAVVGEELGLFGGLAVLALFGVFAYTGIRIARRSDQAFFRYTAAGVTAWICLQALLNLLVALRMMPVMGVTLPFISYGGSSLLANLVAIGFLLAAARQEPAARKAMAAKARRKNKRAAVSAVTASRSQGSRSGSGR